MARKANDHQPAYLQPALILFSQTFLPPQFAFIPLFPSPKPLIINTEWSQSTLPLPPVTCPIALGSVSSSLKSALGTSHHQCWVSSPHTGLEALLRQPWERPCAFPWLVSCPWDSSCLLRCGIYHITSKRSSSILESNLFLAQFGGWDMRGPCK